VDLVQLADEVCREADRQAAAGGVLLVLDAATPVRGNWDRARVKQIISSLVSNAIRYGGGRIEVGVRMRDDGAELSVRDHGAGIHPEILPRLFDAFDQDRARGSGGFGVGLWVVKTLAVAMRGTVTAENCESGGARFCVVLPRG
jgi:signal transduction histidine kinase